MLFAQLLRRSLVCLVAVSGLSLADPIEVGQVVGFTPGIHGAVELVFTSEVGKYYQVQISADMATWDNEGYSVKGTGGQVSVLARTRNLANAYYRLRDDGSPDNVAPVGPPGSDASVTAENTGAALADMTAGQLGEARDALNVRSMSSPLWKPLKRISTLQDSAKPIVIRSLTIGDSWGLNATSGFNANFGNFGQVVGPSASDKAGVTAGNVFVTPAFASYGKTPFEGRYVSMVGTGNVVFGPGEGAHRFGASGRVIVVMYERVSGGGTISVEYETATAGVFAPVGAIGSYQAASGTGTLPGASLIDTGAGAGASEFAIATFVMPSAATPRVRCTWVSGSAAVFAAGVVGTADLETLSGTSRQGHVDLSLAMGGARLSYFNSIPQATWNTLLGWLKPDFIFFREKSEVALGAWQPDFEQLMPKLAAAYSQSAVVCIGSHPTNDTSESLNDSIDDYEEQWCANNGALFIPMRQYFPAFADYSAMGLGDAIHMKIPGVRYAEKVIWNYFEPFHFFAMDGSTGSPGGIRPMGSGVSTPEWWATYDSNIPGQVGRLGIRDKGRDAGGNYPPAFEVRALPATGGFSRGFQLYSGNSLPFWHTDSIGRSMIGAGTLPTRDPGDPGASGNGAHFEVFADNPGLIGLSLQAETGMNQNIMEVRTGATTAAGGTLISGVSKFGIPFANLSTYESDAAADADANLPPGGFYKITGSRAVYQKP